jgi:hypothetical protein
MANKRFNKQVGYKDGGKAKSRVRKQFGGVSAPVRPLGDVGAPIRPPGFKGGGKAKSRVRKQVGGPMSTARRDMTHGYYQPDMGMQGGRMFRGGGAVKKKGSVGVALKGGGRAGKQIGGRANLLEEVGRIDAERMNPNRRAEKARVIGELNRGYKHGKRVTKKRKK